MNEKTLKQAYDKIKEVGFDKFCSSLSIGGNPCPVWLEIVGENCFTCEKNRQKILGELDKKFRKEKLEKLLNG